MTACLQCETLGTNMSHYNSEITTHEVTFL